MVRLVVGILLGGLALEFGASKSWLRQLVGLRDPFCSEFRVFYPRPTGQNVFTDPVPPVRA